MSTPLQLLDKFKPENFNILPLVAVWITAVFQAHSTICSAEIQCSGHTPKYTTTNIYGIEVCQPCSKCPPGTGVASECGGYQDTVCELCTEGTFSVGWSRTSQCRPCTNCPDHLNTMRNCTPTENSKCSESCEPGYFKDELSEQCDECSWCYPDNPELAPPRIPECIEQGMPHNFQCMPSGSMENVPTYQEYLTDLRRVHSHSTRKASTISRDETTVICLTETARISSKMPTSSAEVLAEYPPVPASHHHFTVPIVIVSVIAIILCTGVFVWLGFTRRHRKRFDDNIMSYSRLEESSGLGNSIGNVSINKEIESGEGYHNPMERFVYDHHTKLVKDVTDCVEENNNNI